MKLLSKVELIVSLKERIEKARQNNDTIAHELEKLLQRILKSNPDIAI